MSDFVVKSARGPYQVVFDAQLGLAEFHGCHVLVDEAVLRLHPALGAKLAQARSVLKIQASERAKDVELLPDYADFFVRAGVRRDHELVAIGGGVVQDIACFLAATLLRGMPWVFWPTTLLAQADSCIGSKSGLNVGETKNAVGAFAAPSGVCLWPQFLTTLDDLALRSGVGEIVKIHMIAGEFIPPILARAGDDLIQHVRELTPVIRSALELKRPYVEADEFDAGVRQVLNYGHTFGHALESAHDYKIPHGIAVAVGMDIANFVSWRLGANDGDIFRLMSAPLMRIAGDFGRPPADVAKFRAALLRDKKNTGGELTVIWPDRLGEIVRVRRPAAEITALCDEYFAARTVQAPR